MCSVLLDCIYRNLLIKYEFPVMLLTMLLNNIVLNQNFTIKSETLTKLPLEFFFSRIIPETDQNNTNHEN